MMKFVLVLFFTFFYKTVTYSGPCCNEIKYRLSGNVKPLFYSIKIHPDLNKESFSGEVFIRVKVHFSVEFIEFHSKKLNIMKFNFDGKKVSNLAEISYCSYLWKDFGYDFADLDLIRIRRKYKNLIPPGNHMIYIKYSGVFSNTTSGLFLAKTFEGNLARLVATDFEPSNARRVFPCFDEPSFKAPIKLSLVVPNDTYTALSNMNVIRIVEVSNGIVYKFQVTPPMSTYLLSFVITKNISVEFIDSDNIPFRAYSSGSPNLKLLEFASEVIKFYSDYTNQNYILPKIDFVEFDRNKSVATENWGLITVKTGLLSIYEDVFEISQKQSVIAHELAHFWFGNLVTNEWWDDLWLQEGFAVFMSVKAEEKILNTNSFISFSHTYLEELYWNEHEKKCNPIVNFDELPKKIEKSFTDIVYYKAAAILRMLEMLTGEEEFRLIVNKYITRFAYKTATTTDFLNIVEETQRANLREFMESYLYQNGYPVIYVTEDENKYILTQGSLGPKEQNEFDNKWTIPVTFITDTTKPKVIWYDQESNYLTIPKSGEKWIKLNYNQIGYYRVHYPLPLWDKFIKHSQELERHERDYLMLEAVGLFEANLLSCDVVLRYLEELTEKKNLPLNFEYAFIVFIKLGIVKEYDKEAFEQLQFKIKKMLLKAGGHKMAIGLTDYVFPPEENLRKITEQIRLCIKWLKMQ